MKIPPALLRYTGPSDGLSCENDPKTWTRWTSAVLPLMYRKNLEGGEKIPHEGAQVYAYDHPSTVEPLYLYDLCDRDLRSIAVDELFVGPLGPLISNAGAFPVNRDHPSRTTIEHCIDVVRQGKGLSIAPAGGTQPDQTIIPAFHRGPATAAIRGGAESVVPITFYYHPDDKARPKEKAMGWAAAAAATAAGAAIVALAAPPVAAAAAVTGLALGGSSVGVQLAQKLFEPKVLYTRAFAKLGANLAAGIACGVGAALAGGTLAAPLLLAGGVLAGGLGVLGFARTWRTRDVADIVVSDPIPVKPYVEQYGEGRTAAWKLTEDLHGVMGREKARLTGKPYDEAAPRTVGRQSPHDCHPPGCPV